MKPQSRAISSRVRALHRAAPVVLGYVNPWLDYGAGTASARRMFIQRRPWAQQSVPLLREGGVDVVVYSHGNNCPSHFSGAAEIEYMLRCFDALIAEAERHPHARILRTKGDLDRALREGKLGILLHLTGAPIHGDLAMLRTYQRVGVRAAHPFLRDPRVGGYCGGDPRVGLRPLGREILREMERLGMVVDLAHANDRCFRDALRVATRPVIDSHTCCRALVDVERNCADDQLRAIADTGGVVGAHFSSRFIAGSDGARADLRAFRQKFLREKVAELERRYKDPYEFLARRFDPNAWPKALGGAVEDGTKIVRVSVGKLVDQIARMVDVAGVDHVGVGTDYDLGDICEIDRVDKLPMLTAELVRRGFRPPEIRKILGENFLRVFRQCLPD